MAVQELVSAPAKVAQYGARRVDLRLVRKPIYPRYGPGGQVVGENPGETVEFRNGLLTVDLSQPTVSIAAGRTVNTEELVEWLDGHRLLGDVDEGFFKVEVAAGRTVATEELVDWLEAHPLLGDVDEGFFKVEVAAPAVSEDEMDALMQAAVNLDTDTLSAILEAEEQGWGRESIINNARRSLESIAAIHERAAEQAQGDVEQPPAKAKPKAG